MRVNPLGVQIQINQDTAPRPVDMVEVASQVRDRRADLFADTSRDH